MPDLQFEDALARILGFVPRPAHEDAALEVAAGRVLAEELRSPIDLPMFDNSAMDGYAVRTADVASASQSSPVPLRVAGRIAAGEVLSGELAAGTCIRLFTGSPLPRGADAVVMQEDTADADAEGDMLILAPARPGENVRHRGEDVKRGSTLAGAGEVLTVGKLGLLAAVGLTRVRVGRQPVVGLLATGAELKEPGQSIEPGQIYESNRLVLSALARRAGAVPRQFPLIPDALAPTSKALADALDACDAVVTSGGVSVGEMDFVKHAFEQIGGELHFWKVSMRPGRPLAFGQWRGKLFFGLPGNPVSAFATFLLLVRPALLRWQGGVHVDLPRHPGVLAEPLVNDGARRHFMRVRVDREGRVLSAGTQASHVLASLAAADGLVDVPPQATLAAGTTVPVLRWD